MGRPFSISRIVFRSSAERNASYETARACDAANAQIGWTREDVDRIGLASMGGSEAQTPPTRLPATCAPAASVSAHRVPETPGRFERHGCRARSRDAFAGPRFLPTRSAQRVVANVPNSPIVTLSPRARASPISESTISTAVCAASGLTSASAAMRFTRSDFLT